MRRLELCLAVVGALSIVGCGGSGNTDQKIAVGKLLSCEPPGERIELHNSGISCEQAAATLVALADVKGPQEVGSPSGAMWTCRSFSPSRAPLHIRCSQGKRFFTVRQETDREGPH